MSIKSSYSLDLSTRKTICKIINVILHINSGPSNYCLPTNYLLIVYRTFLSIYVLDTDNCLYENTIHQITFNEIYAL